MKQSPIIEVVFGIVLIVVLAWIANINEDSGHLMVGIILLLWFLWVMNNVSKVSSFKSLIGG